MKGFNIIVRRSEDGYTSYALGLNGVIVGKGRTYTEALDSIRSAIDFQMDSLESDAE